MILEQIIRTSVCLQKVHNNLLPTGIVCLYTHEIQSGHSDKMQLTQDSLFSNGI